MYLLEHDAKELLAKHKVHVPAGKLIADVADAGKPLPAGPWIVKGQITTGGRGKAGIIKKAATQQEIAEHTKAILGREVKGRRVESVRIEQQVAGGSEAYLGLLLDAAGGGVRIIMAAQGGMEIEALPPDAIRSDVAAPDLTALTACVNKLAAGLPAPFARALTEAGTLLAQRFLESEALLIEINPLFVRQDGSWVAGDAKYVTDDSALERQDEIRALLEQRAAAYPEAALKLEHGCDYVVIDPEGEIGLLTTGAGLSMMLVDELRAAGLKPYNFLDVCTGGLRGETTRLVKVLKWISEGRNIKVMLINIFAGITELGEFSRLLVKALDEAPELKVPVVARLVGNGLPAAREVLAAAGIALYPDLDEALAEVRRHLAELYKMIDPRITRHTPVLIQGISGRAGRLHSRLMKEYGTNLVAGISSRKEVNAVNGVPLFTDCAAAVNATGATTSVALVGAFDLLAAIEEALAAGIRYIVTPTEGMPVHDALKAKRAVDAAGAIWVGASTPGMAIAGEAKLGFLPNDALIPGPIGIMSKSGTLSYESGYRLALHGMGTSVWVGVGGDAVKGVRYADLVPFYAQDEKTKALLIIGEIGGHEEEDFAAACVAHKFSKPVFALIAGRSAPEGVTMGHAGALVHGSHGTWQAKRQALEAAGATVFGSLNEMVAGIKERIKIS